MKIQFAFILLISCLLSLSKAQYVWKDGGWVFVEDNKDESDAGYEGSGDDESSRSRDTYVDNEDRWDEEDGGSGDDEDDNYYAKGSGTTSSSNNNNNNNKNNRNRYNNNNNNDYGTVHHSSNDDYDDYDEDDDQRNYDGGRRNNYDSNPSVTTESNYESYDRNNNNNNNNEDVFLEGPSSTHSTPNREGGNPSISVPKNKDKSTSFFAQPGILAAVVGGAVVGLLCAILFVMFIVYRMRKKDEGSYALDEPKRSPTVNSYSKPLSREIYA